MEEWSFEVKWSQILCSRVGFSKNKILNSFCNDILQHSLPFNSAGLSFSKIFVFVVFFILNDVSSRQDFPFKRKL